MAHNFPVQPGGRLLAETTRSRSAAPAAPRRGQRGGGRAVGALVVDDHHGEPPCIVLPKEGADASRDQVGLVAGRDDGHDVGPRVSARSPAEMSFADATESSRSPQSQNHPLPNRRVGPDGERKKGESRDDHLI